MKYILQLTYNRTSSSSALEALFIIEETKGTVENISFSQDNKTVFVNILLAKPLSEEDSKGINTRVDSVGDMIYTMSL